VIFHGRNEFDPPDSGIAYAQVERVRTSMGNPACSPRLLDQHPIRDSCIEDLPAPARALSRPGQAAIEKKAPTIPPCSYRGWDARSISTEQQEGQPLALEPQPSTQKHTIQ
jgi:hypothetical protein